MKFLKALVLLCLIVCINISCFEDNDDNPIATSEINDFVWKGLNLWYFWQQDVEDLSDTRFSSNEEYATFLNSFSNPREIFNSLKFSEDRFSWIVDDYNELLNSLDGISKINGMEFGLAQVSGSSNLIGFVQYVISGTDADTKGIMRGDLFTAVNGTTITEDNYIKLLFSDLDSYTISMAEFNGSTIELTGTDITLNKQVFTENPIFITHTFDHAGKKVGYLLYNQFVNDFDEQLNNAFGTFKANGVEELIVDLRYNPGGHISSAINLSTMITGQFTGQLYLTQVWNDKILSVVSEDDLSINFPDRLAGDITINSLGLDKVYILAQGSSASASELVINSLNPYINVIHIGDITRGKNEFSNTLLDVPTCNYMLSRDCNDQPNPNHTWALQPLLGRNANADGFFDFTAGINPDVEFPENIFNLGVLGEIDEPLFARALQHIGTGSRIVPTKEEEGLSIRIVSFSKMHTITRDNMYIDKIPQGIIDKILQQ